jgi:hypothetical protein
MEKIETNVIKPEIKVEESGREYLLINKEVETLLDDKLNLIKEYIFTNSGKGKSNSEKDELYKNAQLLWREYINELKEAKYNFQLNRPQHKFLTDLVLNKLEYDVNSVFFAIELKDLFESMKDGKYSNDEEFISFPVNATEITYIYHLISKHTVKGLVKDSYLFAEVLIKIGAISKIFNYYDTTGKNLSSDIQDWVLTFEDGVTMEKRKTETIQGEVI